MVRDGSAVRGGWRPIFIKKKQKIDNWNSQFFFPDQIGASKKFFYREFDFSFVYKSDVIRRTQNNSIFLTVILGVSFFSI